MNKLLTVLVFLTFLSCQPYEYIELGSENLYGGEKTNGLIVYIKNNEVYQVNDLGANEMKIPNTLGAKSNISLNYAKDRIAFFNSLSQVVIVDLNGNNMEVLSQYDVKDFEWSKNEKALFLLEQDSSKITVHGITTSFVSPPISNNGLVYNFSVSSNHDVAYVTALSLIGNNGDKLTIASVNGTIYNNDFSYGNYKYYNIEFIAKTKQLFGYYYDNYIKEEFQFDFETQNVETNTFPILSSYFPRAIKVSSGDEVLMASISHSGYPTGLNIYRRKGNDKLIKITKIEGNTQEFIFDWKE